MDYIEMIKQENFIIKQTMNAQMASRDSALLFL